MHNVVLPKGVPKEDACITWLFLRVFLRESMLGREPLRHAGGGRGYPGHMPPCHPTVILTRVIHPTFLGTPASLSAHSRCVYTEHARHRPTAVEHVLAELNIAVTVIYRRGCYRGASHRGNNVNINVRKALHCYSMVIPDQKG